MQCCSVPGCARLTSLDAGNGRSKLYCRYHSQFRSRHGSHWHASYRATDLGPYLKTAQWWLRGNLARPDTLATLQELDRVLAFAGRVEPAMNLRRQSAARRAKVAFARLREAGIGADRLAAIYLAVSALIEDDLGSHRTREFRLVQAAKAVHRLASGTHRRWQMWNPTGKPVPVELHAYPRSSGLVLRKIGETLEAACRELAARAVAEIIGAKVLRYGPHPSHHHHTPAAAE